VGVSATVIQRHISWLDRLRFPWRVRPHPISTGFQTDDFEPAVSIRYGLFSPALAFGADDHVRHRKRLLVYTRSVRPWRNNQAHHPAEDAWSHHAGLQLTQQHQIRLAL